MVTLSESSTSTWRRPLTLTLTLALALTLTLTLTLTLARRVAETSFYHAMVVALELGYRCRDKPTLFRGKVEFAEDGRCLRLYTDKGRVKVPLTDSYFAEPLAKLFGDSVHGDELLVELCGVLKSGRTQLRVRVPTVAAAALAPVGGAAAAAAAATADAAAAAASAAAVRGRRSAKQPPTPPDPRWKWID